MNKPLFSAFAGLMAHMEFGAPDGTTRFSKLSKEAQDFIVGHAVGEDPDVAKLSPEARSELAEWSKPESGANPE